METTLMGGVVTNKVNCCAINKKSTQLALAKDFVKFAYSDEGNAIFTTSTGVLRPFDYTLSEEQVNSLTYYQRSLYELSREETTKKVSGYSRAGLMYTASDYVSGVCAFSAKAKDGTSFSEPFSAFVGTTGANAIRTADDYLEAVKRTVDSKTDFWK
jgi:ABC-type glycerol-3-phosphate transport system substrate-binding protein